MNTRTEIMHNVNNTPLIETKPGGYAGANHSYGQVPVIRYVWKNKIDGDRSGINQKINSAQTIAELNALTDKAIFTHKNASRRTIKRWHRLRDKRVSQLLNQK